MEIRSATQSEFETVSQWAASEGWNPGLNDLEAFYTADPEGFLIGLIDGEIACSISVVKYGDDYGFLGFYIVYPKFRGQGYGMQIWKAGMARLSGRTIGLDGVVEQQDNYRKSGFKYSYKNIRYQGLVPEHLQLAKLTQQSETIIRPIAPDDLEQVFKLDKLCFGAARDEFLTSWLSGEQPDLRQSRIVISNDNISGFGAIRKCIDGYKIGPLFAYDLQTAEYLLSELISTLPPQSLITLDVPEPNTQAMMLAEQLQLDPVFTTARMYIGTPPNVKIENVFGVTTFELG